MLLEENKNTLFGKLVGLINGLYDEKDELEKVKEDIINSMKSLKENKDIDIMIEKIINDKKLYLPNCLTCLSPCGRTSDYSINSNDEETRLDQINKLNDLLTKYESLDYRTLQKEILKVTY